MVKRPLNRSYLSDWINKITRALKRIVIHREREGGGGEREEEEVEEGETVCSLPLNE